MKIGILCNSKLSIPSLYFLNQQGVSLSIVLPQQQHEDHLEIEQFASFQGISIQRWNKKELNSNLYSWSAMNQLDTIWVMTFPYIISKEAIERTRAPIFNFHFAPLPKYKGAQPVFWMIKNGEREGGISVHQLTEKVDGGPLLHFEPYSIKKNETFGSYNMNIAQLNVSAIVTVFHKLQDGNWERKLKTQDLSTSSNCVKPVFNDVQVLWKSMTSKEIESLCRACNPWNKGAVCQLNGKMLKLLELKVVSDEAHMGEPPGTIVLLKKTGRIGISTLDKNYLDIEVAYLEEGFFGNAQLRTQGVDKGVILL